MNKIVSAFAKFAACTAIIVGAPLLAASAINLYVTEVTKDLEYRACLVTAKLDNASTDRCIR